MKYVVQYTLPYVHKVAVGIEANSTEEAIQHAEVLFDEGVLWQDTAEAPLLVDDFVLTGDTDEPAFTVEKELDADAPWPEADISVRESRRRVAAFSAAQLLIEAYRHGKERGGSIDWDELDQAYEAARKAIPIPPES